MTPDTTNPFPKWSCDSATGTLYEHGVTAGKLITGESGAWLRLIHDANATADLTFCFCPRCGVEMNLKHDASAPNAILAENARLRRDLEDVQVAVVHCKDAIAQNERLREALTLAQTTIERLATQRGPFNSAQGTLDVISAALAGERSEV